MHPVLYTSVLLISFSAHAEDIDLYLKFNDENIYPISVMGVGVVHRHNVQNQPAIHGLYSIDDITVVMQCDSPDGVCINWATFGPYGNPIDLYEYESPAPMDPDEHQHCWIYVTFGLPLIREVEYPCAMSPEDIIGPLVPEDYTFAFKIIDDI